MEAKNLVELIREAKPRTALFTTYTLSLSFFEAVLLPVLRQVSCHDIAILVDANEAVASLAEAHVHYAGRRYWVAPVVAPGGGVFHPKLTYLAGGETDVLAIGSGNLTLPGQSGQLETLDAVSAATSPIVFRQFEAMVDSLAGKIEQTSKQAADLLREYAVRASVVADRSGADNSTFPVSAALVHSVERPASDQILELFELAEAEAQAMTVLSPFHTPDAGPIDRLAKALGVNALSIGLDPKTLVAPFDLKRLKIEGARYVTPVLEGKARPLHGKAFEILGSTGVLVATGSINATQQSLEGTKNVEVSLARWLPSPCFEWTAVEPVKFEPNSFVFDTQEADFAYLDATLDSDGMVRGRLIGGKTFPKTVTANILRADVPLEGQTREIAISSDGNFSFGPIGEVGSDAAVQLELIAPSLRATCWLNVTEELASTDDLRREKQCVRHILRGDFHSEDVAALLQILCRAALIRPPTPVKAVSKTSEPPEPKTGDFGDRPFSYLQWQMSGRSSQGRGLLGVRYDDTLRAFIRWLNGDLTTAQRPIDNERQLGSQHAYGFRDVDETEEPRERVDVEELLRRLIDAIPRLFAQHPDADNAEVLASVAGAHALRQMLNSPWTDERRLQPVLNWLDGFSRYAYRDSVRQALQPIALGIALVTAATAKMRHLAIPGSLLKESLIRFGLGGSTAEALKEIVPQALADEVFSRVDEGVRGLALSVCDDVWQAESVDDRLLRIVQASRESGGKIDPVDEAMFPGVFARLRTTRPVPGKPFRDGVLTSEKFLAEGRGCPHCYQPFDEAIRRNLRAKHTVVCNNNLCRKVIFYLEAPEVAERVKGGLNNV